MGGVLTTALSWPWIFYVNIPVGVVVLLASLRYVPESKDEHAHKSFDFAGAVTVTAGLLALVYGIVKAQEKGWISLHTGGFFVLAFVLLAAFVVIERRSVEPLVRLGIFRVRTVRAANVVMLLVAAGLFRDVLLQHALPAASPRLLGARGGSRVPPVHRRDDRRGRFVADASCRNSVPARCH